MALDLLTGLCVSGMDAKLRQFDAEYRALPKERQERLQRWFAEQRLIAEALGLSHEEWFRHVAWAMEHPFDFTFLAGVADAMGGAPQDALARDQEREARRQVGEGAILRPVEKAAPLSQRKLDNKLDRALVEAMLRARR